MDASTKVKEGNEHSYWTYVVSLDIEKVDWHEFRDKYIEFGGDGIYAAWKLSYQEPMFRTKAFLNREDLGIYDAYDFAMLSVKMQSFYSRDYYSSKLTIIMNKMQLNK